MRSGSQSQPHERTVWSANGYTGRMYTQAMDHDPDAGDAPKAVPLDSAEEMASHRFECAIDADRKIEPKDWMPEHYRKTLVRQISQHAHSRDRRHAARGQLDHPRADAQAQGHPARQGAGRRRPRPLPLLGRRDAGHVARPAGRRRCTRGKAKYSSIFNYPTLTWADIGAIGWLVDGAAIMNQVPLCRCSYGPYARAMIRICKEESFHQRQGFESLLTMMTGHRRAARMVQDAVNRWWWPGLMMFGPPDSDSPNSGSRCAGASSGSATTTCARSSSTRPSPQAKILGVTLPDPRPELERGARPLRLRRRSTGTNSGTSSTATARATRSASPRASRPTTTAPWVREAALAHAAKQASSEAA